jgi:hypothetical protein
MVVRSGFRRDLRAIFVDSLGRAVREPESRGGGDRERDVAFHH